MKLDLSASSDWWTKEFPDSKELPIYGVQEWMIQARRVLAVCASQVSESLISGYHRSARREMSVEQPGGEGRQLLYSVSCDDFVSIC
jgi:hypothetical protein